MRVDPVETVLRKYGEDPSQLIGVLQDLQETYNYLSYDTLLQMSEKMQIPLSRIYSLATFFKAFSLKPRGEHLVTVCLGTACHVREAPRIVEEISRCLGIQAGETTPDLKFTLQTVNCLGACALGPVVVTDGEYHRSVRALDVPGVLDSVRRDEQAASPGDDQRIFAVQVACPYCNRSLMSDEHLLDGYPTVRLTVSFDSKHGWLRLSSLYGDYRSESEFRVPAGAVVQCFCPHCHAELRATGLCARCDAPMVSLRVRGAGTVRFCSRNGCKEHMLDLDAADH